MQAALFRLRFPAYNHPTYDSPGAFSLTPIRRTAPLAVLLSLCLSALAGCDVEYLTHIAFGQLGVLGRIVPVDQALADTNLTDDERAKLAITQHVRLFGIHVVGLRGTDSYTVFDYNGMEPAVWVVSASAKHSLTPYLWDYPIIGQYSTRGFFEMEYARRVALSLQDEGYDVFFGRAAGFSTLNFFADPVRQSNLQDDDAELAELILHEMTHQTIFKPNDGAFNEGMATFIGRAAAQEWFDLNYGVDSSQAMAARVRYADKAVIDLYVVAAYNRMAAYYAQAAGRGDPPDVIIANRQAELDAALAAYSTTYEPLLADPEYWSFLRTSPFDNARLLAAIVYQGGLSDYEGVFVKVGRSFPDALAVYAEAANQPDSRAYLRAFAQSP